MKKLQQGETQALISAFLFENVPKLKKKVL
jgi:hypothetical protein